MAWQQQPLFSPSLHVCTCLRRARLPLPQRPMGMTSPSRSLLIPFPYTVVVGAIDGEEDKKSFFETLEKRKHQLRQELP